MIDHTGLPVLLAGLFYELFENCHNWSANSIDSAPMPLYNERCDHVHRENAGI